MKNLKRLLLTFLITVSFSNCTEQTKSTIEQENISEHFEKVQNELRIELDSKNNPALDICNEFAKSSNIEKSILQRDMTLSYEKIKERSKLVALGKLSNEEYFNDVNGSMDEHNGFKTELGKLISNYYKQKHKSKAFIETLAYEKFKEAQELNSELKKYDKE